MYYPDKKQFLKLSRKGNIIPVYRQIQADLDTPVSAFLKIRDKGYNYLLESVEGGEKVARFSFLGSRPSLVFKSKGRDIQISEKGRSKRFLTGSTPLDEIGKIMKRFKFVPVKGLPRFCGGLVGYMGYDAVRFFEKLPDKNPDDLNLPDSVFVLNDTLLIFDHINHTIKIVANVHLDVKGREGLAYNEALRKIDSIYKRLRGRVSYDLQLDIPGKKNNIKVTSNFTRPEFERVVNKAKEYIRKGDIIQVVPSQRFKVKIGRRDHFDIYRNLRSLNPSPYMYFLEFNEVTLVGASPEMLVRCENGIVDTRPIAGTRPRGQTEEEDKKLEQELLADVKEKAEHLMLVDLGRNDLGRVCSYGKVEVAEFMRVERYSHVMHIVSDVRGRLAKGKDIYDVLKAAFPAGTVSGSPKIRAMEIIDELENVRRGPYAGCVGYLSFSGNMDACITIRTIVIKNNVAYIQAGGGIVADSRPSREYQETVNKARAQIEALT
ncbi:MAG: anthranilate synthase component I [Candidatus Omnitrophica bacterium]|nr:anthranilate synthase component I [Candidatus Omnitrophota bacterium]MDD5654130.1 anthranilate synthase component I [Candidatus Omnitrophota bacterium]